VGVFENEARGCGGIGQVSQVISVSQVEDGSWRAQFEKFVLWGSGNTPGEALGHLMMKEAWFFDVQIVTGSSGTVNSTSPDPTKEGKRGE
jgi:hypothetical protein